MWIDEIKVNEELNNIDAIKVNEEPNNIDGKFKVSDSIDSLIYNESLKEIIKEWELNLEQKCENNILSDIEKQELVGKFNKLVYQAVMSFNKTGNVSKEYLKLTDQLIKWWIIENNYVNKNTKDVIVNLQNEAGSELSWKDMLANGLAQILIPSAMDWIKRTNEAVRISSTQNGHPWKQKQ